MGEGERQRIRVTVINDFELIVAGVARLLRPYAHRIEVVELAANRPVSEPVDVVLYDSFAQGEAHTDDLGSVLGNPNARTLAMYTWNMDPELVATAVERGVAGYLSKQLPAAELFDALCRVHAGEVVVKGPPAPVARRVADGDWPGRRLSLTEREAEILVLITAGRTNREIADALYVSLNSVKTHVRNLYRKIEVDSRTKAALFGVEHGFRKEQRRIDSWNARQGWPEHG